MKSERAPYLTTVSYKLFGRAASRFTILKHIYLKSGLSRLYESYMALMLFASLVAFVSAFAIGAVLHYFLFNLTLFQYVGAVLTFSGIISLTVPIMFVLYVLYSRDQRKKEIDANLVYTTGYMGLIRRRHLN